MRLLTKTPFGLFFWNQSIHNLFIGSGVRLYRTVIVKSGDPLGSFMHQEGFIESDVSLQAEVVSQRLCSIADSSDSGILVSLLLVQVQLLEVKRLGFVFSV